MADDAYSCASGGVIAAGRYVSNLSNVHIVSESSVPYLTPDQTLITSLHGSSGQDYVSGRQYRADVSGKMAYAENTEFAFWTARDYTPGRTMLRPIDKYGTKESMWLGFIDAPEANILHAFTARRLDALHHWANANLPNLSLTHRVLTGGSMGAWGTLMYGLRHPSWYAALYPDRPRWRYCSSLNNVEAPSITRGWTVKTVAAAPSMAPEDGGESYAVRTDSIAYVSNTSNKIPWIGWCVGRQDGFSLFSEHVAAVNAMRAAKRGFAFAWNNGDHSTGSILSQITSSYPYELFEIGKGYPLFTNHSGDQDPSADLVGGINLGLTFRNVAETPSSWSCEVTSIIGAVTVDIEPKSDIFTAATTPQSVSIPAANSWVSVSFSG